MIKSKIELKLNLDNLKHDINRYIGASSFGKFPQYLVMNFETLEMLKQDNPLHLHLNNKHVHQLFGIPIAITEGLPIGVVELVG